jgi:hypothetical protein
MSNVNGKFKTEGQSPLGKQECIFTFNVDGESLTGAAELLGNVSDILEGSVDGDAFKFKMNVKTQYGTFKFNVAGRVDGDEIMAKMSHPVAKINVKGQRI